MAQANLTKSIDVGSMFLMDLTVQDSESLAESTGQGSEQGILSELNSLGNNNNRGRSVVTDFRQNKAEPSSYELSNEDNKRQATFSNQVTSIANRRLRAPQTGATMQQQQRPDYLGSSLDRLASIINFDGQHGREACSANDCDYDTHQQPHSMTIIEPQPFDYQNELHLSGSLSDESFVESSGDVSSDTSSHSSGATSLSVSYSNASDQENEGDKGSTTTREDSGVLDMKDLEGQLNNSYDINEEIYTLNDHHNQRLDQEKPISFNIMATNLIKNAAGCNQNNHHHHHNFRNHYNHQQQQLQVLEQQQQANYINNNNSIRHLPHRSGKPTDGSSANYHNNYQQYYHSNGRSKRTISASVPIQVPVRQMRKDLRTAKLNQMQEDHLLLKEQNQSPQAPAARATGGVEECADKHHYYHHNHQQQHHADELEITSRSTVEEETFDDDDTFLDQEYNRNHHNHYPLSEDEDEHLKAEEDPMKLFASIQALARSLHGDAELFGSLPPKRMLESPIRTIALF